MARTHALIADGYSGELERAITKPAEAVGMTVAPSLVSVMISDVSARPGTLPMLQFALYNLFEQHKGNASGLDTYQNGYYDHFSSYPPAGVTTYTNIPGLGGMRSATNWGAGTVNAQAYLDHSNFDNSCLALGL